MKVAIVSRGIPEPQNPMNGIFEWDQALALKNAGVDVVFIVLDLRSIRRKRKLSTHTFLKDGIQVVYGSSPLGAVPAPVFYTLGRLKLRKLLRYTIDNYGKPDIVHGHFTDIGAIAASECKNMGIPCVVTEHSSSMNLDKLSAYTRFMAKRAYGNADRLIAVSEKLKHRIEEHFNKTAEIIPNVVDVESIKFNKSIPKRKSEKIVFVSTGSLLTRKGHDLLVSSFASLPKGIAELIIVGEGPEKENLQRQISSLGLEDSIKLVGLKTRVEISEIYSKADCFVLASRRETFGVVYIEAMLAGLPVIATRCGGPEDFVNESNGILIDTDNEQQLAEALNMMIYKVKAFNKEIMHSYVLNAFGPSAVAYKLLNIYNRLS